MDEKYGSPPRSKSSALFKKGGSSVSSAVPSSLKAFVVACATTTEVREADMK